ncbi:MAG: AP2 domain-containing protein [Candidatus Omnitrophica bacterium]|nr:AP2 domain-containing protein [Candidatus Omnitrophota bacterium]
MKFRDLTDQKFGRLTVICRVENDKNGIAVWRCLCVCGNIKNIRGNNLVRGTKSCGCLQKESASKCFMTHGMRNTSEYKVWLDIRQRCNNPNNKSYVNYGGRGITVCEKWLKFENFFEDMGNRPDGLTIERIDNDKGYYKENCKWATYSEQGRNKRSLKNKTGTIGVSWYKQIQKYQAYIGVNYKIIHLGCFTKLQDAITARKNAEIKYWNKGE